MAQDYSYVEQFKKAKTREDLYGCRGHLRYLKA
jgi:hypothetical protein